MCINKKIVIIGTTASSLYGFRADLIKYLVKQNYQIYAFTCVYTHDELEKIKALGAIPVTYELSRGGLNPFSDLYVTYQLSKKIKAINPAIVLSYFVKPVIYGTLAAKIAKVPKIIGMLEGLGYTFTDQPEGQPFKTKLIRTVQVMLYKIALPKLDHLLFLNPDDKCDLIDQYNIIVKQSHILGGIGLNLADFPYTPAPTHPISFLFIGRLLKEKGIFDFITAIRIVKSRFPHAQFTVLGSIDKHNPGALSEYELSQLLSKGLFNYPGEVTNVADYIAQCSVFILPSYREGVPRSTQEAMAIGRPVITTDVPGCRETVVNGMNGFLVAKWDPQALADKMIYFIENPSEVNKMGVLSYHLAIDKFDVNKVNDKLLNIIED